MNRLITLALTAVLVYGTSGFACKVNKAAFCDDVVSGLQMAATQFPNDPLFAELSRDGHAICDAVRNGKKDIVPGLLKAFIPRFDDFVNKHGQSQGLALVDIGLHILLNHFPVGGMESVAVRPVWGCNFYPEKCRNGVPKE